MAWLSSERVRDAPLSLLRRDGYLPKPRSGPPRHMQKEQAKCLFFFWSERRESNPRESAWEADAIPLGDSRMFMSSRANRDRPSKADAIPFSGSRNRFTDIVYNIFLKKANKKGRLYENFRQIPYHRKKEAFLRRKNPASADLRGGCIFCRTRVGQRAAIILPHAENRCAAIILPHADGARHMKLFFGLIPTRQSLINFV